MNESLRSKLFTSSRTVAVFPSIAVVFDTFKFNNFTPL